MNKSILAICVALSLTSCAQFEALRDKNQSSSYVAKEISAPDSEVIGEDMAKFMASQYPAAKTTIYVESSDALVHAVLVDELTKKGFGIMAVKPMQGAAVQLQYFVTRVGNGILVRMKYSDRVSSRYYGRLADGRLSTTGKIAVREAVK